MKTMNSGLQKRENAIGGIKLIGNEMQLDVSTNGLGTYLDTSSKIEVQIILQRALLAIQEWAFTTTYI